MFSPLVSRGKDQAQVPLARDPWQSRHSLATEMFQQTIVATSSVNLLQKGSLCDTAHTPADVKANHRHAFDSDPLALLQPLGTTQLIKQIELKLFQKVLIRWDIHFSSAVSELGR